MNEQPKPVIPRPHVVRKPHHKTPEKPDANNPNINPNPQNPRLALRKFSWETEE